MPNMSATTLLTPESVNDHPYYPTTTYIPHYIPNENSVFYLLTTFTTATILLCALTYKLASHFNPKLTRSQLATTIWFVLSGAIHIFFEGYYVSHFADLTGDQTLIAQMWKEYALSDSRYLTQDGFVLCVESLTVLLWGPGCWVCTWLVVTQHPARWAAVGLVSLGQVYGDVLYYATAIFDDRVNNVSHSRPEAVYYWVYFVFMNAIWIVVPGVLICQSISETTRAVRTVQRIEQGKKAQ